MGRSSSSDESCIPDLDCNVEGSKHVEGRWAKRGYDESMVDDDGDFGELDSKEGNKTDDDDYGVGDS